MKSTPDSKKRKRKNPTPAQKKELDMEIRGACPNPECTSKIPLSGKEVNYHHIDGDRTNGNFENFIALCRNCHGLADAHIISEADLIWWKHSLVNRQHPRLGAETASSFVKPNKKRVKKVTNFATGNVGSVQQAHTIHNHYKNSKPPPLAPAPDSIAAHAAEKHFIEYLRGEYLRCRLLEGKYDAKRKYHPARLRNAFNKAVGGDPLGAPLQSFDALWRKAHAAVCHTLGARKYQNGYRPHDWDAHKRILHMENS